MIGQQLTGADVNAAAAQITRQVYAALENAKRFQAWLVATPDATLQAAPFGLSSGDVAYLKSAFTDLDKLRQVFEGSATQGSAYDFRTFAKQALGVGLF